VTGRSKKTALLSSVFSGLGNQYASALSTGLGQFVVTATLARLLSPVDYGLFGLAAVYTGLATILSQFGVAAALVQRAELTPRIVRAGFTVSVLGGLLTAALVWITAPLAATLLGTTELTPIIRGLSLGFVIAGPGFVAEGLSQRKLAWRRLGVRHPGGLDGPSRLWSLGAGGERVSSELRSYGSAARARAASEVASHWT
jgi:PST family polysaccharide transporter